MSVGKVTVDHINDLQTGMFDNQKYLQKLWSEALMEMVGNKVFSDDFLCEYGDSLQNVGYKVIFIQLITQEGFIEPSEFLKASRESVETESPNVSV